jgi:hypothetical protein
VAKRAAFTRKAPFQQFVHITRTGSASHPTTAASRSHPTRSESRNLSPEKLRHVHLELNVFLRTSPETAFHLPSPRPCAQPWSGAKPECAGEPMRFWVLRRGLFNGDIEQHMEERSRTRIFFDLNLGGQRWGFFFGEWRCVSAKVIARGWIHN